MTGFPPRRMGASFPSPSLSLSLANILSPLLQIIDKYGTKWIMAFGILLSVPVFPLLIIRGPLALFVFFLVLEGAFVFLPLFCHRANKNTANRHLCLLLHHTRHGGPFDLRRRGEGDANRSRFRHVQHGFLSRLFHRSSRAFFHSPSSILTLPTLSSLLTGSHRRRSDRQCCQNPHRLDDPGDPFVGLERAEFAGGAVVGRRSAETAEGDRWSGRGTNGRSVETKRNGSRYFRRFSDRMQRKLVLISKQECLNIEMLSRLFAHRACSQV
jgi:hypothetical protein